MQVNFSSIKSQVSNAANSVTESTKYLYRKVTPYVPATLGTTAGLYHLYSAYESPNFRCLPTLATLSRAQEAAPMTFIGEKFSNMGTCAVDLSVLANRTFFSAMGGLAITAALTVLLMRNTNPVNEADKIETEETSPDVTVETTAQKIPVANEQDNVSTKVEAK